MTYPSRSRYSTSFALRTALCALSLLAVALVSGCNPFESGGTPSGSVVTPKKVATGTAETTIPLVTVPSVVDLDVTDAQSRLLDGGLQFTVSWNRNTKVSARTVYRQDPEEGDEVSPGSFVKLYVSVGPHANPVGMKVGGPPKPRAPKWIALPRIRDAWVVTGVGPGRTGYKFFPAGFVSIETSNHVTLRARLDRPDGGENIMLNTANPPQSGVPDVQVRVGRSVSVTTGSYRIGIDTGWNQPWVLFVRWLDHNPDVDRPTVEPPIWPPAGP